ncbi:MAG TPA: molybdopterin cofactor-binding domain-containing protein [Methylomirabilota bacterium]|nr:molybdopterin cofactor-binding domain-containing protein [Methylomirabilota bacterium]
MITNAPKIARRSFLIGTAAVGGGLALGLNIPLGGGVVRAQDGSPEVNAWVVIRPDDTVVIRIARSEMGQGTLTGLAQMVAEELECDWSKVTTEYPTPGQSVKRKRVWGDFSTGGSRGIRMSHEYVRKGGATARVMLVEAAARAWGVPAAECSAANSVITHKPSGRTTTYGKVAEAAAKLTPPADVALKDPKEWKLIGKPVKRLDTMAKLTGAQVYGADLKLPGMLNAAIKDCPVFGGKVKSFEAAKVKGMPGVRHVVPVGDSAVAVVADTWWEAKTALDALPIVWDEGPNAKVSSATIAEMLKAGLDADQAFVHNQNGDAKAAIAGAAKKVEAVYAYPFQNHAPMEPMNATAKYTPERCEVWVPTQNGEAAFAATLAASGLPADKCEVYKINLGGGFGRRGAFHDYVTQAVQIAKQIPGTPVKLLWSREEDMLHGRYHPVMQAKLTGGLDANGNLVGLHVRLSGQSILTSVFPQNLQNGKDPLTFQGFWPTGEHSFEYTVTNLLVDHAMRNTHVPPGFWRGVNINQNAIFLECFMDELAHAAGQDALEFRRKLMAKHPKSLAVLNAVADKGGWGKPAPAGVHRGLAHFRCFGSYVAACAEVSVTGGNKVKVQRIVCATDPGHAVNPAQIERQIAGSFVYGLSALFMEECTVKDGHIEQTNFSTYDSMRIAQMPRVESIIMPSGGFWGGVGEPTICVAAPAVLNAFFRATGRRIRTFPLKNHGIQMV